jgi:hypothetical protein
MLVTSQQSFSSHQQPWRCHVTNSRCQGTSRCLIRWSILVQRRQFNSATKRAPCTRTQCNSAAQSSNNFQVVECGVGGIAWIAHVRSHADRGSTTRGRTDPASVAWGKQHCYHIKPKWCFHLRYVGLAWHGMVHSGVVRSPLVYVCVCVFVCVCLGGGGFA